MANLRVNKITGTEVFETTGSVQFDGSGDFLDLSSSSDFGFGTGNFTIEYWIYHSSSSSSAHIFDLRTSADEDSVTAFYALNTELRIYLNAADKIKISGELQQNQWVHHAIVRNGNTLTFYQNGISLGVNYGSGDTLRSSAPAKIGAKRDNTSYLNGHISNFRILKGTALYTKNFTPPTRELTVIPNTVLLCCQSTTRANEEKTGKTITVNGNAVANELTPGLLTDRVKSGGDSAISGSVEFAGTSYLSIADHPDFEFSNKSFTVEGWFNLDKGKASGEVWILGQLNSNGNPSSGNLGSITIRKFSTTEVGANSLLCGDFYSTTSGSGSIQAKSGAGTTITDKTDWSHFAFVRDNDNIRMYFNGIGGTSVSVAGLYARDATGNFAIGRAGDYPNNTFNGFLSNVRVVVGTAVYKDNFIPPTAELRNIPGTVLLCCQNPSSATQEATGKTITVNENATARNFAPAVGSDGSVTFDGVTKINTPNYFYLPTGNTEDRGRGRGLMGGGVFSGNRNNIEYVNIQSTGIAQDFGDLTVDRRGLASCSSSTRGIWGGGTGGTPDTFKATIDYVTISTTGNAQTFGNLTDPLRQKAALSNLTRGVFAGGYNPLSSNIIEYITISSTGNAQDFGDLSALNRAMLSCSSSTRGVFAGSAPSNVIEYITINSTGNTSDFGDLTVARGYSGGCSNPTRGVFGGGSVPAGQVNVIDYITIASIGNAIDFGDLSLSKSDLNALSGSNRGIFFGGYSSPSPVAINTIDYITINSTGNAQDFGDLILQRTQLAGCSDSHGGLG